MSRDGEKGLSPRLWATALVAAALLCLPVTAHGATVSPDTEADSILANGDCSLRDAFRTMILEVNQDTCSATGTFGDDDTIVLTAGETYVLDVNGAGGAHDSQAGDLDTDEDDLTITGNAANRPTIQGGPLFDDRILHVPGGSTDLTLENLIVDNGNLLAPGAGNLGGNIYLGSGGTLTLDNTDVTNGLVDQSGGSFGGGIAADNGGHVMVTNGSQVSNNVAGPAAGAFSQGGGIYITGGETDLTVSTQSAVTNNDVGISDGVDIPTAGQGGGIWVDASNSQVNISQATIDDNQAGGGADNVPGEGGAIGAESNSANLSIGPNVSVSDNQAGGGFTNADGLGGGIYAAGTGTLNVLDETVIASNDAGGGGTGADGQGGGIYADGKTLTVNGAFVSSNTAAATVGGVGSGGGIRVTSTGTLPLMITDTSILNNAAGTGGGIGGGIYDNNNGAMTISGSRINGNSARVSGGGIFRGSLPLGTPADSISTTTLSGNTATVFGGAISTATGGSLSLVRSTVNLNTAGSMGSAGVGGGLDLNAGGTTTSYVIENSTIHQNTALALGATGGRGGGINLASEPTNVAPELTTRSSTISANTAAPGTGTGAGGNLRADVAAIDSQLVTVQGSIVSDGVGSAGQENCSEDFADAFVSTGGNIDSEDQCHFDHLSDQVDTDPLLGTLMDNGGPTDTQAITAASPAFNAVPAGLCPPPAIDQIGSTRPLEGACDAGAFELDLPPMAPPGTTPTTPPTMTPTTPPAKKKCKKGRKLKKGKCVKKKRKKRK
jgi:hypothetical protein